MSRTDPPADAEAGSTLLSGRTVKALIGSVLLATAGYLAFAIWSGWAQVWGAIVRVGWLGIAVALALSLVNYGLRFLRWQAYLRRLGHPIPWQPSLRIYLAGFALTTTPGKAGEAVRGVLLRPYGVPFSSSVAAFLSERLSDLLAVMMLALFGLVVYPQATGPVVLAMAVLLVALGLIARGLPTREQLTSVTPYGRRQSLRHHLVGLVEQTARCHNRRLLVFATAISLVAWGAEAWALHLILRWIGADPAIAASVFVYAFSMLAGAVSILPGGLGGAEAVMVALLVGNGIALPDAIAATIVIRLTTLWFAVVIGWSCWPWAKLP